VSPVLDQPEQRGSKRRRNAALLTIGLASSAFFLWLVVRDADLHAVWLALKGAELGPVLLAVAVIQGVYVAQAARWRIIAGTLELTVRRFYALVLGGIGANDVLPLRIGDLLRLGPLADRLDHLRRGRHPDVGEDQRLLEVVPGLVVDPAPAGDARERARERGTGLAEPVAQPGLDPLDDLGLGLDLGRLRRLDARRLDGGGRLGRRDRRGCGPRRRGAGRRLREPAIGAGGAT